MNKLTAAITSFAVLAGITCSCSDEPNPKTPGQSYLQEKRSELDLKDFAVKAYSHFFPTKSRAQVIPESIQAIQHPQSRSGSQENEYPLYVVNFADSMGYAILSSDPNVEPILAVIQNGSYDPNDLVPGVEDFIKAADYYSTNNARQVSPGDDSTIKPSQFYQYWEETIDTIDFVKIEPRLDCWYGQEGLYSKYCPTETSGCAATAIGMALSFKEQSSIRLTFDNRNETLNLNWPELKKHKYSHLNCNTNWLGVEVCYATDETHDVIGKIIGQVNYLVNINDPYKTPGASEADVSNALTNIGITHQGIQPYNSAAKHLTDNNILLVFGISNDDTTDSANSHKDHIFMIDGVDYVNYLSTFSIYETNGIIWHLISSEQNYYSSNFVHVVWGFDNSGVGYFKEGIINPTSANKLDQGAEEANSPDYDYKLVNYISINK